MPTAEQVPESIATALAGQAAGQMLLRVVCDERSGEMIGGARYHDVVPAVSRVEIGYTWYSARWQCTQVNTVCKLLLLDHAFVTLVCERIILMTGADFEPGLANLKARGEG